MRHHFGKLLTLTFATLVGLSLGQLSFEEDNRLTQKEKDGVDKLKKLVVPKIPSTSVVNKFVNDPLYWVRWLRAKDLDVPFAQQMFLDHLKWREVNKIDTIDKEDWSEYHREFPYFTEGVDKEGRPVSEIWMADWNTRKAVGAGKTKQVVRWIALLFETQSRQLWEARTQGKNVSQALTLVDLEGFSVLKTACPTCLPVYASLTLIYENQYPNIWETINMANMPFTFSIVLNIIRPLMRPTSRQAIKTYRTPTEWEPIIDKKVDKSQRSRRFRGTKQYGKSEKKQNPLFTLNWF